MPKYTQEQIDEAMKFLRGITSDSETMNSSIMILLSALSTAEKNNADWQEYNAELFHRAKTAEAQVAELEARLQGAADRGAYCLNQFEHDLIVIDGEVYAKHEAVLRAAIVGKKER